MAKEFTAVGKPEEVPEGEMRAYQVGSEDVAVANVTGSYHAFSNVCTHKFCQLSEEGELEGTTVTCPCHGSQFDVTSGDVLNGPATMPVDTFEVSTEDGELRIGI